MSDCIEWWGSIDSKGYGIAHIRGRRVKAHRLVWEECFGPIPEDRPLILHRCDNPPCVNPEHLFPGTHADNMRDKNEKGRGVYPGAPRWETCKRNHPLSGDNLIITTRGRDRPDKTMRACRTCRNDRARQRYQKKLEVREIKS